MFKRVLLISTILLSASVLFAQPYSISDAKAEGPSTPRLIVLRDERGGIEAAICPEQGGELSGMRVLFRGRWVELLDKARDYRPSEDWRGKAPLLWPATGRTAPNGYNWKGKFYPMPAHGFVQNMPWKLESKHSGANEAVAVVSLEDTPETRKMYPFGFRIVVEYRLSRGKLALAYTVRAADGNREPMFFSIGNHITFRTPLIDGGEASKMLFYTPATLEIVKSPERLPTGETRAWSLAGPAELGGLGAERVLSASGYKPGEIWATLEDPKGLGIRLEHSASTIPPQPVVLFNLWASEDHKVFSPEPWVGLQNSFNLQKGLVRLESRQEFKWRIMLEPIRK